MKKITLNEKDVWVSRSGVILTYHAQTGKPLKTEGALTGKFYRQGRGYLARRIGKKLVAVHKLVAIAYLPDYRPDLTVDHINGITTDNRACNLRMVENGMNQRLKRTPCPKATSKYRGVSWHTQKKLWQVELRDLTGKRHYLGSYPDEKEAAKIFNKYAKIHKLPKESLNNV